MQAEREVEERRMEHELEMKKIAAQANLDQSKHKPI